MAARPLHSMAANLDAEDNQPTAQFYHVTTDIDFPIAFTARSRIRHRAIASRSDDGAIDRSDWYDVGGGEAGYIAPVSARSEYRLCRRLPGQHHALRQAHRAGEIITEARTFRWRRRRELEHRFQWTAPVLISPHDPNTLYYGGERLFKTTDGGVHWDVISPDLTRNDKSKQQFPAAISPSTIPAPSITTRSLRWPNPRSRKI